MISEYTCVKLMTKFQLISWKKKTQTKVDTSLNVEPLSEATADRNCTYFMLQKRTGIFDNYAAGKERQFLDWL